MIQTIENPVARAEVSWLAPDEGGRKSGPPTARVYAATCVFPLGDDAKVHPDWPASGDALSILLEPDHIDGSGTYKVDFLARDLARVYLRPGADVIVMEGSAVVARATILEVIEPDDLAL